MDLYHRIGWTDPFLELRRFQQDIDRLFGNLADRPSRAFPPVNLWAGEDGMIVSAELPGAKPDDIEISVHKNTLTLAGQRGESRASTEEPATALRRELPAGRFSRTLTLPFMVDPDQVKARSEAGVLLIHLPRPEADRPKHIRINNA